MKVTNCRPKDAEGESAVVVPWDPSTNCRPKDAEGESAVVVPWDPSQVAVARDVMQSIKVLGRTFARYDYGQQALGSLAEGISAR